MSGRAVSSRAAGTKAATWIAAASGGGVLGMSVGVEHPMCGVLALAEAMIAGLALVVLAVCLPEKRSDRLYRWARLILGREEPPSPTGGASSPAPLAVACRRAARWRQAGPPGRACRPAVTLSRPNSSIRS